MKRVGNSPREWPPCVVCGMHAAYVHEGKRYCTRNECQLVASGDWTLAYARSEHRARGRKVPTT